jgi:hypothetical protein
MQFLTSKVFKDFPGLKFIIPHGGGAVPYHWGRYRGIAQDMKLPPLAEHLLGIVFFDTCVYHQPGIELLTKLIPIDNILFASEMVGAVRGIDPETNHHYDATRRYVDQVAALSSENRAKIFEGNARKVYGRLDAYLDRRSKYPPAEPGALGIGPLEAATLNPKLCLLGRRTKYALPTSPRPFIQFFCASSENRCLLRITSPLDGVKVSRSSVVKLPFVCVVAHDLRFRRWATAVNVKLILPPRQSRGVFRLC